MVSNGQLSQIKHHGKQQHTFGKGDTVATRYNRDNSKMWLTGTVTSNMGKHFFEVDRGRHLETVHRPNDKGTVRKFRNSGN